MILPRLIRLKDAPKYLGMDRHRFNQEVRGTIQELRIGVQGIAFDRLDLDAWIDHYKQRGERPLTHGSTKLWDAKDRRVSLKEGITGTLTNKSQGSDFKKALALSRSAKQNAILQGGSKR